jgi:hypothetical protein
VSQGAASIDNSNGLEGAVKTVGLGQFVTGTNNSEGFS